MNEVFPGVFLIPRGKSNVLATRTLYNDKPDFDEDIIKGQKGFFRLWDPSRSKLGAAIKKRLKEMPITKGSNVLYLGASHGYTCSYVSDIVGKAGLVYSLDFAPRVVRDLWFLTEKRTNMIPLLGDAFHPETYFHKIGPVDVVFQDIAQKNQLDIFLKNMDMFLKPNGYAMLALKSRSVDITRKPKAIFNEVENVLKDKTKLIDKRLLEPFEKDHCFFLVQKK